MASDLFAAPSATPALPATGSATIAGFDPRDHRCQCGAWGAYGHGRSADRPGTWFCRAHDPAGGRGAANLGSADRC